MSIGSTNYANPVYVNGYQCWNCTQVDEAKKGVDPSDPKAGPYGVNAAVAQETTPLQSQAVTFGGALAGQSSTSGESSSQTTAASTAPGSRLDLSV